MVDTTYIQQLTRRWKLMNAVNLNLDVAVI